MSLLVTVLTYLAAVLAVALGALYFYIKRQYSYWDRRNVPHTKPKFGLGDLHQLGKVSMAEVFRDIYHEYKHEKFVGIWTVFKPAIMINDPELLKRVLVQDFSSFQDRSVYANEKDDPLSAHLVSVGGAKWKNLRAKLSPTFTSGKMKAMFPIIEEVSEQMIKVLDPVASKGGVIEAKDIIARLGTDVIASCAFGIQTNSLQNPDSEFRNIGRKIFEPTLNVMIRNLLGFMVPELAKLIKLVVTPKEVTKFFMGAVRETMDYREKNNIQRNDFMQTMIQMMKQGYIDDVNKKNDNHDEFTFEQAAAQAFIFYVGGFETSSSTLQFTLYELAKNPEIQEKLRTEVLKSLENTGGKMTYESIHELKYMGMVLDGKNTKALFFGAFMNRECQKDYKLPGTDTIIEKGTPVYIPVLGLHTDSQYYENPEKFDPQRFTDEEKAKRTHFTYLPFGDGPRFCIGQRFAVMQMRAAMVSLLSKYRFHLCDESPKKIVFDPNAVIMTPKGGMHLKITTV